MNALPSRIQAQLAEAEVLEAAESAARAGTVTTTPAASLASPLAPVIATPQVTTLPVAGPSNDEATWEQRYKTLQGMHAKELRTVTGQVQSLTEQVQALANAKPTPPAEPTKPSVDPKDIENFGQEMMEMVQRYVTGAVNALSTRLGQLEANLTGVAQKTQETAQQSFYTLLTKLCPEWNAINVDERWLAWLGVVDPIYKVPRQAALDRAFKNQDAEQVANIFNTFKTSIPAAQTPPSLDNQIQPDGSGNPAPPAPVQKPILSQKSITDFYNDVSRGKYTGKEAEAAAIEEVINQAVAENRVR